MPRVANECPYCCRIFRLPRNLGTHMKAIHDVHLGWRDHYEHAVEQEPSQTVPDPVVPAAPDLTASTINRWLTSDGTVDNIYANKAILDTLRAKSKGRFRA